MRLLTFISLLILGLGCAAPKNTTMASGITSNDFSGTWIPVTQEFSGSALPASAFQNQKLILTDRHYTVIAESIDKGIVKYTGNKMDIYGKDGVNAGKHFTAIYKYENDRLTICYNLAGDGYPEAFETKGKQMYFLSVFKKEAK
jgi:uncharacterized protein (TIGR03067 family)